MSEEQSNHHRHTFLDKVKGQEQLSIYLRPALTNTSRRKNSETIYYSTCGQRGTTE